MANTAGFAPTSAGMALYPPLEAQVVSRGQQTATTPKAAQIEKAAKEFEAILLSRWLEESREAFAGVPGGEEGDEADSGESQMLSLGMQSLANSICNSGGIGIARMISRELESCRVHESTNELPTEP